MAWFEVCKIQLPFLSCWSLLLSTNILNYIFKLKTALFFSFFVVFLNIIKLLITWCCLSVTQASYFLNTLISAYGTHVHHIHSYNWSASSYYLCATVLTTLTVKVGACTVLARLLSRLCLLLIPTITAIKAAESV